MNFEKFYARTQFLNYSERAELADAQARIYDTSYDLLEVLVPFLKKGELGGFAWKECVALQDALNTFSRVGGEKLGDDVFVETE